jgi:hypothetical protein
MQSALLVSKPIWKQDTAGRVGDSCPALLSIELLSWSTLKTPVFGPVAAQSISDTHGSRLQRQHHATASNNDPKANRNTDRSENEGIEFIKKNPRTSQKHVSAQFARFALAITPCQKNLGDVLVRPSKALTNQPLQ